jgi:putative phosphoesterase
MKIGLLSDTHGFLEPKIMEYFGACDEVWHAGDIGYDVIEKLESFKATKAVFGNIDDINFQRKYPEDLRFKCEGLSILMTHIGGTPPNYNPRVKKLLAEKLPDIFICGHSHILRVKKDSQHGNMLYLNPGAAGNHGFHQIKTIIRFEIIGREVKNMEVIELGKRGGIIMNDPNSMRQR